MKEQFELYELDFDGHGEGKDANHFSIELFTENVRTFLLEKDLKSINIFGYSMGGYVALNLAIQNPELVNKIVTLGTKFDWNLESAKKEAGRLVPEIIEEKVPAFAEKLKKEHSTKDWKNIVRQTANMMLRMGNGEIIQHTDIRKLTCEVVIGLGSKDNMVSMLESKLLVELIPKSSFVELQDLPHPIDLVPAHVIASYVNENFIKKGPTLMN